MELTSGPFLALLVVATLAAAAAVVVLWGRLAAPRPPLVLGRVAALVVVNLLVLLTVGALANDTFGFFADWTDLAGAFQSAPHASTSSHGGSAAVAAGTAVAGAGLPAPPAVLPPLPAGPAGQRQLAFTVRGRRSGLTGEVLVELPASYRDPAARTRRYPVIETFHGYPGSPQQWLDSMGLPQVLDTESAAHRVAQALVVAPQLEIPPGRDTECVDGGAGQPAIETWITQDVPDWVVRTFRVRTDRASWAAAGLSAGGWCAAMAALLHPARYGAALVFGGYFAPKFSATYQPWPPGSPQQQRYDLARLAAAAPPPVALWVETSHSDRTSYSSSAKFLRAVRAPLAVHLTEFAHAGHSVLLWAGLVPDAVRWLGSQVPGFAPTGS